MLNKKSVNKFVVSGMLSPAPFVRSFEVVFVAVFVTPFLIFSIVGAGKENASQKYILLYFHFPVI